MIEEHNLPDGWAFAKIQDIAPAGGTRNPQEIGTDDFFYVDIEAVDNTKQKIVAPKHIAVKEAPSRARMRIQTGDIIFSLVRPYLKNLALVPPELDGQVASTAYCVMRPVKGIISKFVFYYQLQDSFINSIVTYGNSPPSAHDDEFLAMSIPIAPTAEQQRIVAAIEQQFTRLDAGVAALKSAQTRLKRYRAAILKAAVEGKLTEAWRVEHPTSEPASQLLARILQERRAKWEADLRAKGKDPAKVKYVEPAKPDVSELGELPEGWCWTILDSVADTIDPQPSHRTPASVGDGIPYVGIGDITQDAKVNMHQVKKVSFKIFEEHQKRYQLKEGDFIFGKIGTIGRPVKLPQPFHYTLSANVVLIQPKSTFLSSNLAFIYMSSPFLEKLLLEGSRATTQAAFGIQKIRLLPFPLPPLEEQEQIVSEVERRLSVVSKLEAIVEANLKRAERLRQSILKEAFAGRLVEQDPDDEPASVLLERIRQEREERVSQRGNGERKGRKQSKKDNAVLEASLWT